jgi:ABC-2 type transport system ATP-binding protein
LAAQGRAVLVSSHLMSEMQDTADHLVVVGRGKVIADTSVPDLIAAVSSDRVTVRTTAPAQAMDVLRSAGAQVAATGPEVVTINAISAERIVILLAANSIPFTEVSPHQASLEEAYMALASDAVEFRAVPGEEAVR